MTSARVVALLIAACLAPAASDHTYLAKKGGGPACSDLSADGNLEGWWRHEEDESPANEDRLDETAHGNDLSDNNIASSTGTVKQGSRSSDDTDANGNLSRANGSLASGFPGINGETTTAYSYGGWFRTQSGTAGNVMGKAGVEINYRIAITTGPKWRCSMRNSGGTQFLADADGNLSYDTWYHVWCNWDGSTMTLYIDGVAQADTEAVTSMDVGTESFTLFDNALGDNFDGYIDDTAIFSRSLSADEIGCIHSDALDAGGYP